MRKCEQTQPAALHVEDAMTRQEKKLYLSQYLQLQKDIVRLADEAQQLQATAEKLSQLQAALCSGMETDGLRAAEQLVDDVRSGLQDRIARLDTQCIEIFNDISAARSALGLVQYKVLFDIFICGMTLQQTAEDIGYSAGHLSRLYNAALDGFNMQRRAARS